MFFEGVEEWRSGGVEEVEGGRARKPYSVACSRIFKMEHNIPTTKVAYCFAVTP
jgi:hypothetical protein